MCSRAACLYRNLDNNTVDTEFSKSTAPANRVGYSREYTEAADAEIFIQSSSYDKKSTGTRIIRFTSNVIFFSFVTATYIVFEKPKASLPLCLSLLWQLQTDIRTPFSVTTNKSPVMQEDDFPADSSVALRFESATVKSN